MAIFIAFTENECINEKYLHDKYIHFGPHRCYPPHNPSRPKLQMARGRCKKTNFVFDLFGPNIGAPLISLKSIVLEKP